MSFRVDGRKVVAVTVTGLAGMIGVTSIWLPFYSDRDKIRGMAEDENMTEDERFRMMREHSIQMSKERAAQQQNDQNKPFPQKRQTLRESGLTGEKSSRSSGSMWKNITQFKER